MTVRKLYSLAAAVGLCLGSGVFAGEEPPTAAAPNPNQVMAQKVANRLAETGVAAGAKLNVVVQKSVVELHGVVLDTRQAQKLVAEVMLVPGVTRVDTADLMMSSTMQPSAASRVMPAAGQTPDVFNGVRTGGEPPMVQHAAPPMAMGPAAGGPMPGMMQYNNTYTGPGAMGGPGAATGPQDPVPLNTPGAMAYNMQGPKMPPYAWPTYAPYPNMSRVGYPTAYPYNAFPFIGPFYPFPKVPMGWRRVCLEWEDGHWYYGRYSSPYDYWRVKFW